MKLSKTEIVGCYLIEPTIYRDDRGFFMESYNKAKFEKNLGLSVDFVQDNHSVSSRNVLRGLHYQKGQWAQAKLVRVVRGRVRDIVVDLRTDSPTFGRHVAVELSSDNSRMLWIPKGLAHGFLSLEDDTIFCYKCDAYYNPKAEAGIRFNDPDLDLDWGVPESEIKLSPRDRALPFFRMLK
ncbi:MULTISPECIES: dTDP-4-dehydrorhamnose 3,5-epimerase [unclassified Robiginitalea]|uniref:dTDP-4-dehydrorhamnose 3,5-epimerase n=1 Tax=Robiginitalea TaxID=252306 RepID=UPI00234BE69A|nr:MULTISPECIES: dTDP-4-dehydrorhamnose 3,5-epimerase [unclassified Robiginitalea]MDC6353191.1 dTDP-4-dehydrorhamnose 3,5-epimerase [Robiginitalea sp. PM2]MDC6373642.1 dTDP-4-dehydrorhamnose 3,5-epimerase [Robiginitalea sp. SP8]